MTRMLCRRAASIPGSPSIIGPQSKARVKQRWRHGGHCQSDGVVPLNLVPTERAEHSVPRRFPYPAILAAVGLFLVPAAQADGPTRKQVACMLALNAAGAHVAAVSVATATDRAAAGCQIAAAKGLALVTLAELGEFNRCKRFKLRHGATSALALQTCVGVETGRLARTRNAAQALVSRKCEGVALAAAAPGECAADALPDLFACVGFQASCGTCNAVNGGDHVGRACHQFND